MKIKIELELDTERDSEEIQSLLDIIESIRYKEDDECE